MLPRITNFNVLDDMFNEPFFTRKESTLMKTDIREEGDNFILEMELPGSNKSDINIDLEKGYLNITASTNSENEDKKKNYIRKERYYGQCSRSFYVGENITEEDINASFKNGILTLSFPKNETKEVQNKKKIEIND